MALFAVISVSFVSYDYLWSDRSRIGEAIFQNSADANAYLQKMPTDLLGLPRTRIVGLSTGEKEGEQKGEPIVEYIISIYQKINSDRRAALIQQIATAVATALATVIGFYFGSRTAQSPAEPGPPTGDKRPTHNDKQARAGTEKGEEDDPELRQKMGEQWSDFNRFLAEARKAANRAFEEKNG